MNAPAPARSSSPAGPAIGGSPARTWQRLGARGGMLEPVRWRRAASGEEVRRPIRHLFLFIGAEPNTDWLAGSGVALDRKGFVLTGADATEHRRPLETSRRGVFAI